LTDNPLAAVLFGTPSILSSLAPPTSQASDRFHIRERPVVVTLIASFGSKAV